MKTRRNNSSNTLKQRLRAAKKKCYAGYDIYNYRMNQKGEFYDCAPAGLNRPKIRRRTVRRRT